MPTSRLGPWAGRSTGAMLNACVFRTTFAAFEAGEPVPRPLAEALAEVDRQLSLILDEAKLERAA